MSKSSRRGSASAPSADIRPDSKKLLPRPQHLSQDPAVDTAVRKLLTLSYQPLVRCTTAADPQPLHTNHTIRARVMHNPAGSPSSADVMLSPTCTGPITVIEISTSFFFRKRLWGRTVPHPALDPGKRRVSLILISFQDGLRRSTVVVRLPFRSSGTDYGRGRPSAGNTAPHVGWSRRRWPCCSG